MRKRIVLIVLFLGLLALLFVGGRTVKAGISVRIDQGFIQTTFVNQSVEFTATPLDGTPPYSYQWCTQLWTSIWGSPIGSIVEMPSAPYTFQLVVV